MKGRETVGEEGWTVLDGENDNRCAAYGGEGRREGGRKGDRLYQCRSSNLGTIVMNTY